MEKENKTRKIELKFEDGMLVTISEIGNRKEPTINASRMDIVVARSRVKANFTSFAELIIPIKKPKPNTKRINAGFKIV